MSNIKEPDWLDWVWITRTRDEWAVRDMERTHVQNSLQWCIRNRASRSASVANFGLDPAEYTPMKDGRTYDEWITAFTARLMDPACK